jgi:hypothetical protein
LESLLDVPELGSQSNGNAYLVSHKESDKTAITWQSVDYTNLTIHTTGMNITLPDNSMNFQLTTSKSFKLGGFTTMSNAIGKNGFINITADSDSDSITITPDTIWKFPENLPQLNASDSLIIEYVVVKTNLIVGKVVKQQPTNTVHNVPDTSDETIVHVTVNKDGIFDLQKVNDDGSTEQLITLERGATYLFVYQDNSFNQHPLRISDTPNGYWPTLA